MQAGSDLKGFGRIIQIYAHIAHCSGYPDFHHSAIGKINKTCGRVACLAFLLLSRNALSVQMSIRHCGSRDKGQTRGRQALCSYDFPFLCAQSARFHLVLIVLLGGVQVRGVAVVDGPAGSQLTWNLASALRPLLAFRNVSQQDRSRCRSRV
jgi:hypothetical protein